MTGMVETLPFVGRYPDFPDAACDDPAVSAEDFFPPSGGGYEGAVSRAKAVCADCPERLRCLAWAFAHDERGVWGGMSELERRAVGRGKPALSCSLCGRSFPDPGKAGPKPKRCLSRVGRPAMSRRGEWTDDLIRALAHLAAVSRPHGARAWDEPGVVAGIRKLIERGFGMQEVIDRVFAHAWDAAANTPGTLLTPKTRVPVEVNPVPFPVTRAEECRLHPGEQPGLCRYCAADRLVGTTTPPPRPQDPPSYDDDGRPLKHTPLRELFEDARATTTEETHG
jgi:WhiB family redox-sensing transcriptional regulator